MENVADAPMWWRWRFWTRDTWAAVVMFTLLAVIVLGELSDFFNDREQTRRDNHQECVLGNLVETNAESIHRLRAQAPVLEAARRLIAAETDSEKEQAVIDLRAVGVPQFSTKDLAKPQDCER